jgi:hypothetical protein
MATEMGWSAAQIEREVQAIDLFYRL